MSCSIREMNGTRDLLLREQDREPSGICSEEREKTDMAGWCKEHKKQKTFLNTY